MARKITELKDVYDLSTVPEINELPNVLAVQLVRACAEVGYDGSGAGGLKGWLRRLAENRPDKMAQLLAKLLPDRIEAYETRDIELTVKWED